MRNNYWDLRNNWKNLVKIIIGLILVTALVYFNNPALIISTVLSASPFYLAAILPIYMIMMVIYTVRWIFILSRMGCSLPISVAYQSLVGSAFLSDFTPARVGDLLRPLMLRDRIDMGTCLSSIILDHFIDILMTAALGTIGLLILPHKWSWRLILVLAVLFIGLILMFLIWLKKRMLIEFFSNSKHKSLRGTAIALDQAISSTENFPSMVGVSLLISCTAWLAIALRTSLIARALGYDVSVPMVFLLQPLVGLLSTIPITISGLGLAEGGMAAMMSQLGVPVTAGISIALIDRAISMSFNALIGWRYALKLL